MAGEGLQRIFGEISGSYEVLNHVFTLGFDRKWRKKTARMAASDAGRCLDVCTGTGELAIMIAQMSGKDMSVFATDFSESMLAIARSKPLSNTVNFVNGNSENLPFSDNYFDFIVAGFAGRNLNSSRDHLVATLKEFRRVLKPGGRFIHLETSQPHLKLIKYFFHCYIKNVVRTLGQLISGSKGAYTYFSRSIITFYSPEELLHIFYEAGFRDTTYKKLLAGIAAIHTGLK